MDHPPCRSTQALQGPGQRLLVKLAHMLAATAILQVQLAFGGNTQRPHLLGQTVGIDEPQLHIGLVALIALHQAADRLAQHRGRIANIGCDAQWPLQALQQQLTGH